MHKSRKLQKPLLLRAHLWQQVLIALVLGIGLGLLLSPSGVALLSRDAAYDLAQRVALPGQLFLATIQMVVIPLVISSIILGITSSGDTAFLKKAGLRIVPYFVATTSSVVVLGITVAMLLSPGEYIDGDLVKSMTGNSPRTVTIDHAVQEDISLPQRIVRMVPENPSKSLVDKDMLAIVRYGAVSSSGSRILNPGVRH